MITMSVLNLQPSLTVDPLEEAAFEKRDLALRRRLQDIAPGLSVAATALRIWSALSHSERASINASPHFCLWLRDFAIAHQKSGSDLAETVARLLSFLLAPALREDISLGDGFYLLPDSGDRFTIFGSQVVLRTVAQAIETHRVHAAFRDGFLILRQDGGAECYVPEVEFWAGHMANPGSGFALEKLPIEPHSGIVIDSSHRRVLAFMEDLNRNDALDREPDLRPASPSQTELVLLSACMQLMEAAWPEFYAEMLRSVRIVAPFRSSWRRAFTNTAWQGMIFINEDFSNRCDVIDRLTHEASHLRLNTVISVLPLHAWGRDKTVSSPFRTGKRPVNGLYHGVFVFARVCLMLDRVARLTNDMSFRAPIPTMLQSIADGVQTLRVLGGATAAGDELLNAVGAAAASLSASGSGHSDSVVVDHV